MTLYATTYSGNSLLGYPGEGYRRGYAWIISTGMMMSIMVTFQILVPKLRPLATREGFVTPGDFLRHRFAGEPMGRALEVAVAALMILALGNFLLAQLVAIGHVTGEVTGGLVPYWVAVVGLAAFILVYETLGGMRAVAWTDSAQGLLMLVGLGLLLHWVAIDGSGLSGLAREVGRVRPEAVAVPDWPERWNWISTVVLLGFGGLMYPQAIQRIFAARSGAELKRALALMGFMPLTTTFVVMLIGIAAIPRFAGTGRCRSRHGDAATPRRVGRDEFGQRCVCRCRVHRGAGGNHVDRRLGAPVIGVGDRVRSPGPRSSRPRDDPNGQARCGPGDAHGTGSCADAETQPLAAD